MNTYSYGLLILIICLIPTIASGAARSQNALRVQSQFLQGVITIPFSSNTTIGEIKREIRNSEKIAVVHCVLTQKRVSSACMGTKTYKKTLKDHKTCGHYLLQNNSELVLE